MTTTKQPSLNILNKIVWLSKYMAKECKNTENKLESIIERCNECNDIDLDENTLYAIIKSIEFHIYIATVESKALEKQFQKKAKKEFESNNTGPSILDQLLKFIHNNPGCTRKQIRESLNIGEETLGMYLSSYYGYKEYSSKEQSWKGKSTNRPNYFRTVDFKPVKGRKVLSYYLNEKGKKRVKSLNKIKYT
jgi:hypothetical protein